MNKNKKANKNGLKILVIGDKAYQASQKYINGVIELGVKKNEKQNVIIALQKDGIVMLKKDVFKKKETLMEAVAKYIQEGYKVTYTKSDE